ncbi:hypothetical protein JVT61DRAFT_13763 [Boletus reticuloceps]|uniref:Uncharacterized protein n=1 Tax=Boletus reticuloceps TaxID=495285 RepID=A0A8I3AD64_9AGAM|nr:hypothetical protein JVT61DRAFT_13763 [Boletus reticuloceps]
MSANKYANLPDIDTAPDVYETEDVFPSSREAATADGTTTHRDELDVSNLISPEQATQHFRKAERARRPRTRYTYPPSSASSTSTSPTRSTSRSPTRTRPRTHALPLPARLRLLQADLAALEAELEDPSNPALTARAKDGEGVDPGEMIRGLVDVRRRLERVRWEREGRGRLVGVVVGEGWDGDGDGDEDEDGDGVDDRDQVAGKGSGDVREARRIVEMDKRVGELENWRLKLLLSDLERVSASQMQKRQQAGGGGAGGAMTVLTPAQDAVLPLLSRLAPSLPHIPHILTRLRTLSVLHGSASEFHSTMAILEEEQRRTREALEALNGAIANVESSLESKSQYGCWQREQLGGESGEGVEQVRRSCQVTLIN